jgi:PAS domain S-box-containing protein
VIVEQLRIFKANREFRKKDEIFQAVTENAADMIALVDVKGRRLYNSPAYKRVLGYSPSELSETSSFEQIHPDDRMRVLEAAREARESGVGRQLEYRIKHKDGSWRVLESVASTIHDAKGEVAKLVIVNRDITERKRAEATGIQPVPRSAHGIAQPAHVHGPLAERLRAGATRDGSKLCPAAGECGSLQGLQRSDGDQSRRSHPDRDCAPAFGELRQDDATARDRAAASDASLFRLGADEFTILLETVGDPSDALRIARRLQEAVAAPFPIESREVRASASVGIALTTVAHTRPEDVLKDADVAMRRAKAMGGSRCEVFDEAMHTRAVGRLKLESDLRPALTERQFRIHYQPVLQLDTRRIMSFEALLRWEHPTQGSGILVSIGHWLMVQACRQLREWEVNDRSGSPMHVTVNVSARQSADARLANDIQDALQQTGVDPSRLQLEMTEKIASADPKLTVTAQSHLKHFGIGTVLDDFGTSRTGMRVQTRIFLLAADGSQGGIDLHAASS